MLRCSLTYAKVATSLPCLPESQKGDESGVSAAVIWYKRQQRTHGLKGDNLPKALRSKQWNGMVERKVDDTVRFLGKNVTFAREIASSIGIDNRVKNYTNDYTDNWRI